MFQHGFIEMKFHLNGDSFYQAKSISFESMDEDEFQQVGDIIFYEGAITLGISENEFKRHYMDYL